MIPVLFKKDETQFRTYGLGELSDFLDTPEVKRERNGHYTFYMKYALDGSLADQLEEGMKIKSDAGARTKWQTFEINRVIKKTGQPIEVFAKHISMRTAKDALKPRVRGSNLNGQQLLQLWRNNLVGGDNWEVWSDITTQVNVDWSIEDFNNAQEVLAGREGSILDRIGGEYEFDNQLIRLWRQMGRTAPTVLEYGRNIVSVEKDNQEDSIYTSVYPYAVYTPEGRDTVEMVTLPEIYIDSPYIDMYDHRKVQTVDFTTEFDFDKPPTVARLRELTSQYIENNEVGSPWENIRVEYQDLSKTLDYQDFKVMEEVELNDVVPVFYPKFNIMNNNAKVVVTVYDPVKEEYKYIELGVIGQRFRSVLTGNLTERLSRVEKEQKQQHQYIVNSAGNRIWYTTPDENVEHKPGDVWFEENGQYTRIRVWNGSQWEVKNDNEDVAKNAKAIADAQKDIQSAQSSADTANQQINDAINAAGFSSLTDLTLDLQNISNQAEANAQTALSRAIDAHSLANDSISRAQDALSSANNAVGLAQDASSLATTLSGQVSDFELTVDGFNQTVNNYENQVAQFTSDVNGLNSTVASYETQVDEFGNTVSTYATQVSQFENTVSGLNSTVSSYQSDVNGYRAEVSTLTNTVSGFESTVTEVRNEFDNLEIGGRNLLRNSEFKGSVGDNRPEGWSRNDHGTAYEVSEIVLSPWDEAKIAYHVKVDNARSYIVPPSENRAISVSEGESVTISVRATDSVQMWYSFHNKNGQIALNPNARLSGTTDRKFITITVPSGATELNINRIGLGTSGSTTGNVIFESIKVEKGNKATDWTPAPEDMATSVQVSTLSNTVDGLKSEVESYEQTVDGYSAQVASFENTVNGLNSTVSNFQSDVNGYESQVATLTNTVDGFNATVESVQADYSDLSGSVQSLGASIGVVEGQITNKVWQTDIQSAVDDIEVGGRNLLRNSNDSSQWGGTWTLESKEGHESIHAESLSTTRRWVNINGSNFERRYDVGTTLTLSGWFYVDSSVPMEGNTNFYIRLREGSSGTFHDSLGINLSNVEKDKWVHAHATYTLDHRNTLIQLGLGLAKASVYFRDIKLEKGNKATDWTPAPEDTMELISHVETEWKQTAQGFEQSITQIESDVNGKASLSAFNTLESTVNGTVQRIGNAEGDITQIESTVNGLQTTVDSKASQSQVTQLATGLSSVVESLPKSLIPENRNLSNGFTGWSRTSGIDYMRVINNRSEFFVSNDAVGGRIWHGFDLEQGKKYRITFEARTHISGRQISVGRGSANMDRVSLTTDARTYEVIFESDATSNISIYFHAGGTFEIGNLQVFETTAIGKGQITQLSNQINLRVSKGELMSQINIEAGRTLIQSERLYLDAESVVFSGKAFIPDAAIETLTADKLTAGTIDADEINVINLNVNSLVGNRTDFVQSSWNDITNDIHISAAEGFVSTGHFTEDTHNGIPLDFFGQVKVRNGYIDMSVQEVGVSGAEQATAHLSGGSLSLGMGDYTSTVDPTGYYMYQGNTWLGGLSLETFDDGATGLVVGSGELRMTQNRLETLRGGNRHLYIVPSGTGRVMVRSITGAPYYPVQASQFLLENTSSRLRMVSGNTRLEASAILQLYAYSNELAFEIGSNINAEKNLNMRGNTITNQSDARLKHDIRDHTESSLDKLNKMRFVDFRWNKDEREDFGLIAQEVQQIAPELISEDEGILSINNTLLNMMTTHAIQELSKEHENTLLVASHAYLLAEQHEDELECLRKEVKKLKEEIEELRGMVA